MMLMQKEVKNLLDITYQDDLPNSPKSKIFNNTEHSRLRIIRDNPNEEISPEEVGFDDFVEILKKPSRDRTTNDILAICKYMSRTDLLEKLQKEKLPDDHMNNILNAISSNMEVTFLEKNKVLFKAEEIGDKFYIVLKGRVAILEAKEYKMNITIDEYYNQLLLQRQQDERYLFNKTIKANQTLFPINDMAELDRLGELFFKLMLRKKISEKEKNIDTLKAFLKNHGKTFNTYGISEDYLYEILLSDDVYQMVASWESYLDSKIKLTPEEVSDAERFRHFSKNEVKEFSVFQYRKFMTKYPGQYFGDFALESFNKRRQNTIIAEDDCILTYVDQKIYHQYISEEKKKIRLKDVSFIHENFFFKAIKFSNFEKFYFNFFIPHEYERGYTFYKQGDKSDFMIIVQEGEVELSTTLNIMDIQGIIKEFVEKLKNNKYCEDASYLTGFDNNLYLKNKSKEFNERCFLKKLIPLYKLGSRDIIGMEDLIIDCNRVSKATVISKKAIVYTLEFDKLQKILEREKFTNYPYNKLGIMKVISLMKRLFHYKETTIKVFEKNYNNKIYKEDINKNFSDCVVKTIINTSLPPIEAIPVQIKESTDFLDRVSLLKPKNRTIIETDLKTVGVEDDEIIVKKNNRIKQRSLDDSLINSIKKQIETYNKKFISMTNLNTLNSKEFFFVTKEKLTANPGGMTHVDFLEAAQEEINKDIIIKKRYTLLPVIEKWKVNKQKRRSFEKKLEQSYSSPKIKTTRKLIRKSLKLTPSLRDDFNLNTKELIINNTLK
jgi:CRP-like cAMP-binding protein